MPVHELPQAWRAPPRLQGRHVALEPLRREHAEGLRAALAGDALSRAWYTSVPRAAGVDPWLDAALEVQAQGRALPFAVRDAGGEIVGSTRFYDLEPAVPRLGIGYTWYVPRVQRTGVNTDAKRLLLAHAFETLGCLSVGSRPAGSTRLRAPPSRAWARGRTGCCATTSATPTARRATRWCSRSSTASGRR